jgi:colanic acid biosynthesis glycosyl transferase WcaI
MRILLLSMYYAPDMAANAAIMTQLVEELQDLGHAVTVVTAFPHYSTNRIWDSYRGKVWEWDRHNGTRVARTYLYVPSEKSSIFGRILNYLSFNALSTVAGLRSGRHDVILAPSPPLTIGLSAYLISRFRDIPYVYNVQDIYPDIAVQLGVLSPSWLIGLLRQLEDFVYRKGAAVTVLSPGGYRNLRAKGVPESKLSVIPNFADTQFIRPLPKANTFARKHGLHNKFVLMYAGNVGLSQNLDTTLEAARQLKDLEDVRILIVGNGSARESLKRRARQMDLQNVVFLPFQDHTYLPEMYASADVSLVSLREEIGQESVPSKAYTIMASGRPILAAVGENAETKRLVERAECGLWVPPGDPEALARALRILYDDAGLRRQLGDNGRATVEAQHTPGVIARKYLRLFQSLRSKPPSKANRNETN